MPSLIRQIKKTYGMAKPHERKTVLHNFASLSVLQAITYLLPVLILPYLFRVIGPEKFGLIAFAQAFVQYFMILTDYGFSISATKEISLCQHDRAEISKVFSSVMMVKIALAVVSLILLGCIVYFVPKFRDDWMVYVLSFGAVLGNTLFPVWFFQGTEKMRYIADLNIAGGHYHEGGGEDEHGFVGEGGYPVLLREDLYRVGDHLEEAQGAHPVGSVAFLEVAQEAALEPDGHRRHDEGSDEEEEDSREDREAGAVHRGPPWGAGAACIEAQEVRLKAA